MTEERKRPFDGLWKHLIEVVPQIDRMPQAVCVSVYLDRDCWGWGWEQCKRSEIFRLGPIQIWVEL